MRLRKNRLLAAFGKYADELLEFLGMAEISNELRRFLSITSTTRIVIRICWYSEVERVPSVSSISVVRS